MATTTVHDDYRERGERRHYPADRKGPPGPMPSLDSYNYDNHRRRLTISGHHPPAHTRHASEGSPSARPSLFLGRGGGFKRPQLPRQPSTRRRRASDETGNHHHQQQGLFDSFRRLSLDQQKLQEQEEEQAEFYNYQEVFQQMKSENPVESLGALQQLTIARIAELKAQRQQEEQLQLEEQHRREEEERLRNQTLAKKYVDKWVGKINPLHSASDGHTTAANAQHHATGKEDMLTHFIPTGSRPSTIMRLGARRISVESSTPTIHSSLGTESVGRSNENNMYVNAGEDQAGNMAPRKSVGDISSMHDPDFDFLDDDKSVKSVHSHFSTASGLFVDAESVMTSGSRLSDGMSKVAGSRGAEGHGSNNGNDENGSQGTTEGTSSIVDVVEAALSKCTSSYDEVLDIMESMSHARSEFSDSANFSRASSSGLIVGFPSKDEEDSGLIVGFGDRSRRREKQEEREKREKGVTKDEGKVAEKERIGLKDASQRSDPIVW